MAVKLFLVFIGSLLVCSITLAVTVKKLAEGLAVSGKKPLLYGSVTSILASLAAYLSTFISSDPFELFWLLGGVFLIFGIIYFLLFHNRYFYIHKQNSNKVLMAELLFGLSVIMFTVVIFSSLQYFFRDRYFLFYPLLVSTLLFFVPILVFHSFQAAYNIPATRFPTWQYPVNQVMEVPDERKDERILVIGFEISKRASDIRKTYFRVGAPETWKLGDLFYHFINEHNDPQNKNSIEFTDHEYEPYEWWFHKKAKWYQAQKILNPEYSVRENGILENTVIICERVPNNTPISNTYKKNYHER